MTQDKIDTEFLIGKVTQKNESYQLEINLATLNGNKEGIDIRRWKIDGEERRPLKGAFFTCREAKQIGKILHEYFTQYYEKPLIEE